MLLLLLQATSLYAWDFGAKLDAQRAGTDNVNLANTSKISDTYSTYGGYLQAKSETFKFKLKGKLEQYSKETSNDNYSTDFSVQYKPDKTMDFTAAVFKQVYNGTSLISTDTTSDNNGARFLATFTHEVEKETSLYFSPTLTTKKYPKIATRQDTLASALIGLEHNVNPSFMINPEFSIQKNNSKDSYYSSTSFGPSLLLSYTPNDSWDFSIDGNYSQTNYSNRTYQTILRGKTITNKEIQKLFSANFTALYSFSRTFSLQGKYSTSNNTSNNPGTIAAPSSAYQAKTTSFDLVIKI